MSEQLVKQVDDLVHEARRLRRLNERLRDQLQRQAYERLHRDEENARLKREVQNYEKEIMLLRDVNAQLLAPPPVMLPPFSVAGSSPLCKSCGKNRARYGKHHSYYVFGTWQTITIPDMCGVCDLHRPDGPGERCS